MVAAEIDATTVAKFDLPTTILSSSTNRRIKMLYLEATKVTTADWLLLTDYLTTTEINQIIGFRAIVEVTADNTYAIDVLTLDGDDYYLDLTSADVGSVHVFVYYYEANS